MSEPGERRLDGGPMPTRTGAPSSEPWSRPRAIAAALAVGLVAALTWALLRSVLDISVGSLVVAALGGWGIGACLRRAATSPVVAALLALGTWVVSLLLAWFVAMAILPGSSRALADRLAETPFLEWVTPQLGAVEFA